MNIRVLNLAYGTLPQQVYEVDALAQAVEKAWLAGIVVVVASGNDGKAAQLRNPAYDPCVIAVGSAQYGDTNASSTDFQQRTDSERAPCGARSLFSALRSLGD